MSEEVAVVREKAHPIPPGLSALLMPETSLYLLGRIGGGSNRFLRALAASEW